MITANFRETVTYLLRGTGRRRAADYIPVVEAERAEALARVAALEERLAAADDLILSLCCRSGRLQRDLTRAIEDRDLISDAHLILINENDELAARLIEVRMENANLRAIWSPAPADLATYEPIASAGTLWDLHGGRAAA